MPHTAETSRVGGPSARVPAARPRSSAFQPRSLERGALYLYCFTVPLSQAVSVPVLGPITDLTGALAIVSAFIATSGGARLRKASRLVVAAGLFVLWASLSLLWTADPRATLGKTFTYLQLFTMLLLLHWFLRTYKERNRAMQAFVLGASVGALTVVYHVLAGQAPFPNAAYLRYTAAGTANPNRYGAITAVALVMAWYLVRNGAPRPLLRAVNVTYLLLAPLIILVTQSRSAFLTVMPLVAVLLVSTVRSSARTKIAVIALLSVATLVTLTLLPESSLDRLRATYEDPYSSNSIVTRLRAIEVGLSIAAEHPFVGVGSGAFPHVIRPLFGRILNPHNTYIGLLAELGVIGVALFGYILVCYLRAVRRSPRSDRTLALLLLLMWLLIAASASWQYNKVTWLLFFFGGFVPVATSRRRPVPSVSQGDGAPSPGHPRPPLPTGAPPRPVGPLNPAPSAPLSNN